MVRHLACRSGGARQFNIRFFRTPTVLSSLNKLHKGSLVILLVAAGLVIWGLFPPGPLQSAIANNLWSIQFIHAFSKGEGSVNSLSAPPPTHAHAGLFLGIQAIQNEDYDSAKQALAPLLEKGDPIATDAYAQILFHIGQYQGALEIWQQQGNLVSLEKATWPLYDAGEKDLFFEVWQMLYQADHEPYASSLAYTLLSRGEYDQAISILDDALAQYPDSEFVPDWWLYLGDTYKGQQRFTDAENAYHIAITLNPTNPKFRRNLGFLYWELKDYSKALVAFRAMADITPADPYPFLLIAQTYERDGERDQALEAYQKVLSLDPQNADALQAIELLKQP